MQEQEAHGQQQAREVLSTGAQQPAQQQQQEREQQRQQQRPEPGQAQPPSSGWAAAMQADPLNPIGLQAYQLQLLQWEGLDLAPLHPDQQQQDPCSSSSRKAGQGGFGASVDASATAAETSAGPCTAGAAQPAAGRQGSEPASMQEGGGPGMPPGGSTEQSGGGGEAGVQLVQGQGRVQFTAGTPWWRQ
jgi:hypothetical protein